MRALTVGRTLWISGLVVAVLATGSLRAEDCNGNGIADAEDIASGTSADCNRNARPDECDTRRGPAEFAIGPLWLAPGSQVESSDYDGDGDLDLAVGSPVRLFFLLNAGDADFTVHRAPTDDGVLDMTASDLDRDGVPELVVAMRSRSRSFPSIRIFSADGGGEAPVTRELEIPIEREPAAVATGDIDGDGRVDIAYAEGRWGGIVVVWNDGASADGGFTRQAYLSASATVDVLAGDLDGDGDSEIIAADDRGDWTLLEHVEGRELADRALDAAGSLRTATVLHDLDGDHDLDLLSAVGPSSAPGALANDGRMGCYWILENDGAGRFAAPRDAPVLDGAEVLTVTDLDADGVPELLTGARYSVGVYQRLPSGEYERTAEVGTRVEALAVFTGDFDGDGHLEVGAAGGLGVTLIDNEAGVLAASPSFATGRPFAVAAADLNADGIAEIIASDDEEQGVRVLSRRAGGFTSSSLAAITTRAGRIAVADVDADGHDDVLVPDKAENVVVVLRNRNGTGELDAVARLETGAQPWTAAAADIDGDGRIDIATADWVSGSISLFWQEESEDGLRFTSDRLYVAESGTQSVALGDIDGDGRIDIVANSGGSGHSAAVILLNAGERDFDDGPRLLGDGCQAIVSVGLQDLDADDRTDVILVDRANDEVSIFWNEGSDAFRRTSHRTLSGPFGVVAGDLDGDGDLDLVLPNEQSDSVSALINEGSRGFRHADRIPVGNQPCTVALGDVDGDGDLDVITANVSSRDVRIVENITRAPVATDADGDGVLDDCGGTRFLRGDVNGDGTVGAGLVDGVFLLNYQFLKGPDPACLAAADVDDDGQIALGDALYLFNHGYLRGPAPPAPYPACGSGDPRGHGCEETPCAGAQ